MQCKLNMPSLSLKIHQVPITSKSLEVGTQALLLFFQIPGDSAVQPRLTSNVKHLACTDTSKTLFKQEEKNAY